MNTKLVVDRDNRLQEIREQEGRSVHPAIKAAALGLSYLFHPVFVPLYLVYFLLFIQPFLFVGFSTSEKVFNLLRAFVNYTFFPLVSVFLLRALHLIGSIKLKDRRDRIIPFVVCNIWYFWIWYVWRNLPEIPREIVVFAMAVFLASAIGLMFNIYIKISMHAIALGTVVAFLCGLSFGYPVGLGFYLSLAILITGLVCTARLLLSDHSSQEIYWGLAVGLMAVVAANIVQ